MYGSKGLKVNKRLVTAITAVVLLAPLAALAAGGGGHADSGVILKDFIYRCVNFAIMVGLLGYFVTKPIRSGLKGRREEIENKLKDAEAAKQAAEARFREYNEKLAKATEEVSGLAAAIKREGEVERDRIVGAAREQAAKIEQEAKSKAAGLLAKAKSELREEASRLAVELAENKLKSNVTAADQKRLIDEYMQKVGELH